MRLLPQGFTLPSGIVNETSSENNMNLSSHRLLLSTLLCLSITMPALAYDQPQVNLGATSFLDGGPPAGPGWYVSEYMQYYTADRLKDNNGNNLPLPKQDLNVGVSLTQLIYQSSASVMGGNPGLNIILPWVMSAAVDDGLGNAALRAQNGIGDIEMGPFLQFAPVMGLNGPRFVNRIELTVIAPTGQYNRNDAINPGSNFWSFDPYWAATYWVNPKWTVSWRLHYLWNGRNSDPNAAFGPGVTSTQAGQAVHANFATAYAVTPQLRLGLNGYWFQQISDTKANGNDLPGRRERVWAIGPGAIYSFSKNDHVFFNAYFEMATRNRPEGQRYQIRYVHHF